MVGWNHWIDYMEEMVSWAWSHLLYEIDHAGLSVGHLPVERQRLEAVVAGKWAPCAEVHGAAGLSVAGNSFPPVFVLWREQAGVSIEEQSETRTQTVKG